MKHEVVFSCVLRQLLVWTVSNGQALVTLITDRLSIQNAWHRSQGIPAHPSD